MVTEYPQSSILHAKHYKENKKPQKNQNYSRYDVSKQSFPQVITVFLGIPQSKSLDRFQKNVRN